MMEIKSWCLVLLILNCCEAQSSKCWLYTQQYWVISCTWYLDKVTPDWWSTCAWYVVRPDMRANVSETPLNLEPQNIMRKSKAFQNYQWPKMSYTERPPGEGRQLTKPPLPSLRVIIVDQIGNEKCLPVPLFPVKNGVVFGTTTNLRASTFITPYRNPGDPYLYYIWGCIMTTPLPETDGEYIYYFQDLYQRNIVANRLVIRSPGQPTTHSCPQNILEGIRLICNCTTPNSGNPPGILSWPGYTNTSQLIVDQVRRGSQFTCQLRWNGMFANVTYSPQVIHPPTSPPVLSGYTSRDSLWEGSSLTLNCTVYGGKPLVLSVNVFCESGVAIQPGTLETRGESVTRSVLLGPLNAGDNGTNCWCNATWQPEPAYFQNRTPLILTVFTLPEKSAFPMAAIIGCGCGVVLILTGVIVISVVIITKRKERTNNLYGMDKENNGTIRSPDLSNQNENTNQDPTLQYLTAEGAVYSVIKKPSERRQTENGKYSDKNDIRSSATGNINNEEHSVPHHTAVIPSNLGQNFENDVYAVPQKKLKLVAKVKPNLKPKPPSFSYTPSEGTNVHAEELSLHAEGPCVGALEIPSETDYYNICQQSVSVKHSYDNVELRPAETNSSNITEVTQNDGVQEVTWQGDAQQVMRNDGVQEVTQQDNAQQVKQNNDGDEYDVLRLSHNAHEMQFPDPLYNHI